jgi:superfamily II DNA or RNA helicase
MNTNTHYDLELNENDCMATQPEKILIKLKPHQLTSLHKAIEMENNGGINYRLKNFNIYHQSNVEDEPIDIKVEGNVGILGDKVGYGKTLLALSVIASNNPMNIHVNPNTVRTHNNYYRSYSYISITSKNNLIKTDDNILNTTLVIVPRGPVYVQWEETIKKNTNLRLLSITNLNFIKSNIPKFNGNNRAEIMSYLESFDVVLIKNTTLTVFCNYFQDLPVIKNWKRIMVDESHDIQNKLPHNLNYYFFWHISGTYIDLLKGYNNTQYTSGIREMLNNEQMINLLLVKNSNSFIKNSFSIPEPIEKTYLCKLPPNYLIARRFLNGAILEKINANDFAGAIREMGGKSDTEDNIIELVSRELKKDLWNKERERAYISELDISMDDKQQKLKKLDIEIEIQKNKINDLTERIKSLSTDNCVICMDTVKNPIMLECTHLFCGGCIMNWIQRNNNCPYCRTSIASYNNIIAIVNQNNTSNPVEEILYKEDTFISIIKNKPDGKFLVFTRNDNGFDLIKKKMMDDGIKFEFLKGNTQHMMNVLDKFKSGEIKIILLNTQYAGSGIDINYATDVIIYHAMGIDKQQAIGRAQRAGRKEQLYIHNLCYEHEI